MTEEDKRNIKNKKLGEILKSLDFVDDDKLTEILRRQKNTNMKLGEVLSSLGCVDKEVILSLVGKQLGFPYLKLSEAEDISKEVIKYIPEKIARMHMMIPFDKKGDTLKVAMAEPQNEKVKNAISILTNLKVSAYITTEEEIIEAINKNY